MCSILNEWFHVDTVWSCSCSTCRPTYHDIPLDDCIRNIMYSMYWFSLYYFLLFTYVERFFYLIMTCVNNTTDWLIDWLNWLILLCAGLPGEHVLASAMAGPASGVLGAAQQDRHRETRERHVEHHLDPGHVPTQWESCQVPSDHCRESHVEAGRPRTVVVRHQVSNDLHR